MSAYAPYACNMSRIAYKFGKVKKKIRYSRVFLYKKQALFWINVTKLLKSRCLEETHVVE